MERSLLKKASHLAEELAKEAMVKLSNNLSTRLKAETKDNESDVVTELDREIESFAKREILSTFPEHNFLGEEFGKTSSKSDWTWVVDPLDGTQNFVKELKTSCFSIALCYRGMPVVGVIADPFYNELFTAIKGEGSKCNGEYIKVNKSVNLLGAVILMELKGGKPWAGFELLLQRIAFKEATPRILGSSALTLANVASGRGDGLLLDSMNVWDIAAGVLIVEEAGGIILTWEGKRHQAFSGQKICGGSKDLVFGLLELLQDTKEVS